MFLHLQKHIHLAHKYKSTVTNRTGPSGFQLHSSNFLMVKGVPGLEPKLFKPLTSLSFIHSLFELNTRDAQWILENGSISG